MTLTDVSLLLSISHSSRTYPDEWDWDIWRYNHVLDADDIYWLDSLSFLSIKDRFCSITTSVLQSPNRKRKTTDSSDPCPSICGRPFALFPTQKDQRQSKDGFHLQCPKHKKNRLSIRNNSFFSKFPLLPIPLILKVIAFLSCGVSVSSIHKLIPTMTRISILKILHLLQILMGKHLELIKPKFELKETEVDEMYQSGTWVLGAISRKEKDKTTQLLWMEIIPNRTKVAIQNILDQLIPQGEIVYTDALASYFYLQQDTHHFVINKAKQGFCRISIRFGGKLITKVHVNNIESHWRQLRDKIKLRNAQTNIHNLVLAIYEFLYDWYAKKLKHTWFDLIKIKYKEYTSTQ